MKTVVSTIAIIGTAVVAFFSIGGFFADYHWRLAWYSNPRPHFAAALLIATLWFVANRQIRMSIVALLLAIVNISVILPLFVGLASQVGLPSTHETISILHLNTNRGEAALQQLQDLGADILFLQEVTPRLDVELPGLFPDYNVVHSHPHPSTHGSAMLIHRGAAIASAGSEIINLPEHSNRPLLLATLKYPQHTLHLLNLHTTRPHHAKVNAGQQYEFDGVANWSKAIQAQGNAEIIIIGDFNATPWSTRFWKFLREGNLQNSQSGFGLQNTWPSNIPLIFGIPIDHAVHSSGIQTLERKVVRTTGTDHAILYVEFGFVAD